MNQEGQSLIELIVAIGIFVISIASLLLLILNSYVSGRLALEMTKASFLAQEGIEAVRSIRDNSWDNLISGFHGLTISNGHWVFQGTFEDISDQLREGKRIIIVEDLAQDRKKITSQVNWSFAKEKTQEIKLITYLTNWQKISQGFCAGTCTPCLELNRQQCRQQDGCFWIGFLRICLGTCTPCENFLDQTSCENQLGCYWTY